MRHLKQPHAHTRPGLPHGLIYHIVLTLTIQWLSRSLIIVLFDTIIDDALMFLRKAVAWSARMAIKVPPGQSSPFETIDDKHHAGVIIM
jgi:hypothetical protein